MPSSVRSQAISTASEVPYHRIGVTFFISVTFHGCGLNSLFFLLIICAPVEPHSPQHRRPIGLWL
ncbi:hypothetical protein TIFTF001_028907 [Ficus carica]|uniref:Uncharacterized protein n=1 Tax=Ficus carica TaxID=3494 RepID=A0AA88DRF4_FICCA|nr:hypothetical protein TIFTF001_028907 [Ficus carica]